MGRQIAWLYFQTFNLAEHEAAMMTFADFTNISIKGQNLRGYLNDWDKGLKRLHKDDKPGPKHMESLFRRNLDRVNDLKQILGLYDYDIDKRRKRSRTIDCVPW